MVWQTVGRPGYFGRNRDKLIQSYDLRYGVGCWQLVWRFGEKQGKLAEAVMVYEDAYFNYIASTAGLACKITQEAGDVYDDSPTNVQSGYDYAYQETSRTHLQDIAIRRCLVRLGQRMKGESIVQIRDAAAHPPVHELSLILSPGRVPFHRPEWIVQPELGGWWLSGSVESWYQSNKFLQVGEHTRNE